MLSTKRLVLRNIKATDQENIYRGLSNPSVIKYYGISFNSLEATKEQMDWFQELEDNRTGKWWIICDKATSVFVGAGGFNNLSKINKKAEIGFWLLPEFWGLGYMQEAMPLICEQGFSKLGLHRIEGLVESENLNCKRALEKLQFKYEHTDTDCESKNGKLISIETYSKLKK